jgi:small-conductance mechanosensitive channel
MSEVWNEVVEFFERFPYLEALAIIVGFAVLAWVVDCLLTGSLRRLTARSETEFDDKLVRILHRPIFLTVGFIGLILATHQLDLSPTLEKNTVLTVQTILVIVWVAFGLRFLRLLLGTMKRHPSRFGMVQHSTESLLSNAASVIFFIGAIYAILLIWDINVTGLVASAGIVGLALSFAAQDTLANLFAGVAILSDKPYEVGDFIILDTGERGEVTKIGLRSTRLLTRDDVEVSIPNGVMGATKIVNEAGGPPRRYRIRTEVGVAYGSDIDEVVAVLTSVAERHPKTLEYPEPRVRFRTFGGSSLDFELLCWIERPVDRGLVLHELNSEIYRSFAAHGITIPFAQQDLYIKEFPSAGRPSTGAADRQTHHDLDQSGS